ncbi:MAG: hypothetical protein ACRD2Z_18020 [Thermoanaerobaculia bacterium]
MSRYRMIVAGCAVLLCTPAATGSQELALDPDVGPVAPRAVGADCAGGEIYDDGAAENGYSGNPAIVSTFEGVQQFTPAAYPGTYDTVCVGLVSLGGPNLDFEIEVRDDDGVDGGPGTLLGAVPVSAAGIPGGLPCAFFEYDITSLGLNIPDGNVWIGVRWNPMTFPSRFICADESPATLLHPGFVNFDTAGWQATQTVFPGYRAKLVRAIPGEAEETGVFESEALEVDYAELTSDANGVFEPGEIVDVAPAWNNAGTLSHDLLGSATAFTGPAGPVYDLVVDQADYGMVDPTQTASCRDTGLCYQMGVDLSGGERPALHWDASFQETLSEESSITWTLHLGDSFADVARSSLFYPWIETLLHHSVSGDPALAARDLRVLGCAETEFCPANPTTREQAAVFLLKTLEGSGYVPPACVEGEELFTDVPFDSPFCAWIEDLGGRGVTAGCGGGDYCPESPVTRAQVAVLLLKTLLGSGYAPPECTGLFGDVACPSTFANWIEDLATRGITAGCGSGNYCPADAVSRGQIAVFLSKTFGLSLYGP